MTLFIQTDATGAGAGSIDANQALIDLGIIVNGDTGFGADPPAGNRQLVTYARSDPGIPPVRMDALVNTSFTPDYGLGAGPQTVPMVVVAALDNFTLNDGTSILIVGGTALPPSNSGLGGAGLNTTTDCLVIYDTTQNQGNGYCVARAGTGGTLDLQSPNPVILYHELSHAFRIVNNNLLALTGVCNPSSPEENAAIVDENDLRNQMAAGSGSPAVLRDPGIHCAGLCAGGSTGTCCIIASVASGSPVSTEVSSLRRVRDGFLRKSEIGFAFFDRLHRDYYGFSPQVCTLMATRQDLRPLVLDGFVRPLVTMLGVMEKLALAGAEPEALGAGFLEEHDDRAAAAARLATLDRGRAVLSGDAVELPERERELAGLLAPALDSDHVRWALVEPVGLYREVLGAALDGATAEEVGRRLRDGFEAWAAQMPLDDVWASLTAAELREALDFLDFTLLRSPQSQRAFRRRLQQELPDVTAIAALDTHGRTEDGRP